MLSNNYQIPYEKLAALKPRGRAQNEVLFPTTTAFHAARRKLPEKIGIDSRSFTIPGKKCAKGQSRKFSSRARVVSVPLVGIVTVYVCQALYGQLLKY